MMKKYLFITILSFVSSVVIAQNELYVKGNDGTNPTLYVKGADGTNPTLYVKGEIVNDNGIFQNDAGDVELTGDFTNTVTGAAKYESTGEVKFSNTTSVTISGTMNGTTSGTLNGTASGINQFNQLKINSNSTTADVNIDTDVNIHTLGSVVFLADGKIVTTTNTLFVRNTAVGAISGYTFPASNTTVGATTRYINGNLQRSLVAGTYEYPVGDGSNMVPFKIVNNTGTGDVLGYVEAGAFMPNNSGYFYCDVATHPGTGTGYTLADATSNTPDGAVDQMLFNLNSAKQWNASLVSGAITDYDLEVFPGTTYDVASPYNTSTGDLRYLLKDGNMYDASGIMLSNNSYPGIGFTETGFDNACPPSSGYKVEGMTSFSKFRLGGVSPSSGALPVELISLEAYGVDNEFIQVAWETATEINNQGFNVQRSTDGIVYTTIGFVDGFGNTSETQSYTFDDEDVVANQVYYYRLKQIDFDGASELTNTVSASLQGNDLVTVSPFIPNPTQSASNIEIQVSTNTTALIVMYNTIGQVILNERVNLNKGLNVIPFNIDGLASGLYQTSIKLNDKTYSRKLQLVK